MSAIRITKEFRYEGAHALYNYDGKCKHIHGHSYILYVTLKGSAANTPGEAKDGMLIDFTDLKAIINKYIIDKFDHALVLKKGAALAKEISDAYSNVIITDFQPTCENLICFFADEIKDKFPKGIELYSIKLYETATSFVEWYAVDNSL